MLQLPAYLQEHNNNTNKYYGTLSYNRKKRLWSIKADPIVTDFAKRLFPGSDSKKRGEVVFANHNRFIADVNWLMLRYPLQISQRDLSLWTDSLKKAQSHYISLNSKQQAPQALKPPSFSFKGELSPFQEEGLAFLQNNDRALLADEMGLGKTVQTLAYLANVCSYPVLIVCPSHLINNWCNEIDRFLGESKHGISYHVIRGMKPYNLDQADIYIIHYLLLRSWKHKLESMQFETVIFDEIQELRHGGTEKYSAASLISSNAKKVIGLSGTPIYNNGGEIWQVINILDFNFLGSYEIFTREWCYGYGNNVVINPDKLGEFLSSEGIMLRRRKQDVLKSLAPKRRLVTKINSDEDIWNKLMQGVIDKIIAWKNENDNSKKALLAFEVDKQERQATGIAKAPYVAQFTEMLLESGEKVLLFAHHHAVFDILKTRLHKYKPCFITGKESTDKKQASVDKFMSGKTNLCCISLRAAAGLNLQRASCVVFAELDWSPAVHAQAEDRAHRIGQEDSLLCYYLVSENGSDASIQDALGLKLSQFKAIMQDPLSSILEERKSAEIAKNYIESLAKRYLK